MPAVLPSHPASLTAAARGEEQEPAVPRMHRRPSSQPAPGSGSGARPEGLSHFGKPQGAAAPLRVEVQGARVASPRDARAQFATQSQKPLLRSRRSGNSCQCWWGVKFYYE